MSIAVLGPVEAAIGSDPVSLKGSRQRAVLARLLIAKGRVVPVDRLVDDLWEVPPAGAVAAIRTFVADLRRALEPGRPSRQPARSLVTAPSGYALLAVPDAVDAWRFEAAVGTARRLLAPERSGIPGHPAEALPLLEEALALWRGPAYPEFAAEAWARAEIDRLDELRMLAVERRAEALLALGRAAEVATDLRGHAGAHPLREDAWRLLALALYRAGRQGEALAELRRARETLVTELGVDPGPRLRELEADILGQAAHLFPPRPPAAGDRAGGGGAGGGGAGGDRAGGGRAGGDRAGGGRPFVGRDREQAALVRAAEAVARRGVPALVLVSGDAGAGKTALAEALSRRLAAAGWTVAWGRSPEYEGTPDAWPWAQITDALAGSYPAKPAGPYPDARTGVVAGPETEPVDDPPADPVVARFRRHRATESLVSTVARRGPVLLVLDDLHQADGGTLDVLVALLTEPAPVTGPVLVVGAFRTTGNSPELTAALARLARIEPTRVYLGGLSEAETGDLARALAQHDLDGQAVRLIQHRTGGNPFFVREVARLLAVEGSGALHAVPAGVRDVIRHRLAQLPEPVRDVLRRAAVLGRDVDLEVLEALAAGAPVTEGVARGLPMPEVPEGAPVSTVPEGAPVSTVPEGVPVSRVARGVTVSEAEGGGSEGAGGVPVLDALEMAVRAGFLTDGGGCGRLRFTHILVRDTLYEGLSAPRRARWHAEIGAALEWLRPHDTTALAYHFGRAPGRDSALRAAGYARAAAERAERDANPYLAAELWGQAVQAQDRAGGDPHGRLEAIMGLCRALAVTGRLDEARRYRAEAVTTAEQIDDPEVTAGALAAFEVPAIWTRNDDEPLSRQIVQAAERALVRLGDGHAERRGRLLSTIALELRGITTDRGRRAAREAVALARAADDPAGLAFALNASFMHAFERTGMAAARAAIGAELVALSTRHNLVTFEVLGRLVLLQAHCARGEFAAADAEADAADTLAGRYDLPLVGVFTQWYSALRLSAAGQVARAEAAYRDAHLRLAGSGMPGMADGLLPLALLSLRMHGRGTGDPVEVGGSAEWGGASGAPSASSSLEVAPPGGAGEWGDWGPYQPWVRPLALLSGGDRDTAAAALRALPESPHDLLREARLCLAARAALALDDRPVMRRLYAELRPAAGELAGAGSGVLTFGPVSRYLAALAAAVGHPEEAVRRSSRTRSR